MINIPLMSEAVYRKLDETHVHASMLKTIYSSSSKHLKVEKSSEAMSFGTAVHMFILEPDKFDSHYIVCPDFKPLSDEMKEKYGSDITHYSKTAEFKKQKADFEATIGTRTVLSQVDMERLRQMRKSTKESNSELYKRLIEAGRAEVSVVVDEMPYMVNGKLVKAPSKARIDNLVVEVDTMYIVDVKSCQSAKKHSFKYDSKKYGYDIQGAFYVDLVNEKFKNMVSQVRFLFLAIETQAPYLCSWFEMGEEMYNEGKAKIGSVIGEAIDVINGGEVKGYSSSYQIEVL